LALLGLLWSAGAVAHDGEEHPAAKGTSSTAANKVVLIDASLIDRHGRAMRFVGDALGDAIVAMDFVYTSCTTACPLISAVMAQVQDSLGARLGDEFRLVTLSIDPVRDTPKRLDAHAAKFGAGEDWIWLTGKKAVVDEVLLGLEAYTPEFVDHPSQVMIGDPKRGVWSRIYGFPDPEEIVARMEALAAAREASRQPEKTSWMMGD
jgi:protein SCO1/2